MFDTRSIGARGYRTYFRPDLGLALDCHEIQKLTALQQLQELVR